MSAKLRRGLRALSTVLIVAGTLMLADAVATLVWQEPVSALYARIVQDRLGGDLEQLETLKPSTVDLAALEKLATERRRMAFLARRLRADREKGAAVGRILIDKIGANFVLVNGTDGNDLRKGPGIYDDVPFPGAPGTTAIAGHRTTYAAPFRRIDRLDKGDRVVVEMPYGRFTYEVERTRIVKPTEVSVIDRVAFDRLVLSACHPLYSAAQRIVVFARLIAAEARGAAQL
ncbi:MAG TPA: class E sortase [Solirubrobacteraceae bacterium]|nr:class E sortase [Solirubrobacteraceae bacterium]